MFRVQIRDEINPITDIKDSVNGRVAGELLGQWESTKWGIVDGELVCVWLWESEKEKIIQSAPHAQA